MEGGGRKGKKQKKDSSRRVSWLKEGKVAPEGDEESGTSGTSSEVRGSPVGVPPRDYSRNSANNAEGIPLRHASQRAGVSSGGSCSFRAVRFQRTGRA